MCVENSAQPSKWATMRTAACDAVQSVPIAIANADQRLGELGGWVAAGIESTIIGVAQTLQTAASRTAAFVKNNWKPLVAYLVAWMVVLSSTGLMYGFQAVALPLTIGLSCGIGFGIIVGLIIANCVDPSGKLTLWNLLNRGIQRLDPNGTRQIVLSVAITVLLAACVVYPYVMGAFLGIFLGIQLATKIATQKNLGRDPADEAAEKEQLQQNIEAMKRDLDQLKIEIQNMQESQEKEKLSVKIGKMMQDLQEMTQKLEKVYLKTDSGIDNENFE